MGFLLKIAIFAFVAWGIWKTANRWFNLLGGNRPPEVPRQPDPPPRDSAQSRQRVVEDTYPCPACGAYIGVGAAKCSRPDCPQP
jgi:hypothetical protein